MVEACRQRAGGDDVGAFGMLGIDPRAPPGGDEPLGASQLPPRWRRMLRFGTEAQIVSAINDGDEVEIEIVGSRRYSPGIANLLDFQFCTFLPRNLCNFPLRLPESRQAAMHPAAPSSLAPQPHRS